MALPAVNPLIAGPKSEATDIEVPADGFRIKAHLARPMGTTTGPAVVVIHAHNGLQPVVRDVADGLASSGYIAVAPDLLSREGGTESIDDVPAVLRDIPRERCSADAQAVVRYLKGLPEVTRIGIIGFCFGGGVTWRVATECADIAAAVPCYGSNPPLENVPNIRAAVYAIYGELDERINAGIPDITKALDAAGVTYDMKVDGGAGHAFMAHTSETSYHAEAAEAAWADALAWFDKHLKG